MPRIRHILPGTGSRSRIDGNQAFFLRNQAGDTASFAPTPQSRYGGWLAYREGGFVRVLADLEVRGPAGRLGVASITNTGTAAFWEYVDGTRLGWKLLPGASGLTASFSTAVPVRVTLDIRRIYEYPEFGRSYVLTDDGDGWIITYADPTFGTPLYLSVRAKGATRPLHAWRRQEYSWDAGRHSPPDGLYVYDILEVETDSLAFGFGGTADEAREIAVAASKQRPVPPSVGINHTHDTMLTQVATAKATVTQALRWLQAEDGIWAGLPWFHQVWSRDELIAALGFTREQQFHVIERYLGLPLEHGELPTFLGSGTTCSDGLGWLCLLVKEYGLTELDAHTRERLLHRLREAHIQLSRDRMVIGLIHSGHNATWMDTIGREGFPLEIQAMYGLLLEHLEALTGEGAYREERAALLRRVRRHYWHAGCLRDRLHDDAIRPNVFLAYLLQPDLLAANLWQTCFDTGLEALGLPWGGLASISKHDGRFHAESTGQDNASYHNGDSWFFMNNLAAMAMLRLNYAYYGKAAVGILEGSTDEILWHGMLGMPGEISSASRLESWGCGIQAFSGGTYLALLKEFEDYSAAHERDSMAFFWEETALSNADSFLR